VVDPYGVMMICRQRQQRIDIMSRFHGYRTCTTCEEACTQHNFVDHDGKRFCTACWIAKENPKHDGIDEIRASNKENANKWKRQKQSRTDGPQPVGPQPVRKK